MNCFQAASADFFESAETSAPPLYNLYAALPVFLYKSTRSTVKFSKTEQGYAIFSRGGPACPPAFRPAYSGGAGAHTGAPLRGKWDVLEILYDVAAIYTDKMECFWLLCDVPITRRGGPACPPAFRPIHRRGAGAHIGAPLRQNGTFLDFRKRSNHPHGRNGTFLDSV